MPYANGRQQEQQQHIVPPRCTYCGEAHTMRFDYHSGDQVCVSCGRVQEERSILGAEAERTMWQCLSSEFGNTDDVEGGDDATMRRENDSNTVGLVTDFQYGRKQLIDRDEQNFFTQGQMALEFYFADQFPDSRPLEIELRTREIFRDVFFMQREQKNKNVRKKFSRKMPFLIASIWIAFQETKQRQMGSVAGGACPPLIEDLLCFFSTHRNYIFVSQKKATSMATTPSMCSCTVNTVKNCILLLRPLDYPKLREDY